MYQLITEATANILDYFIWGIEDINDDDFAKVIFFPRISENGLLMIMT